MSEKNSLKTDAGGQSLPSSSESFDDARDFIENAPVPLHKLNEAGIIIWANQAELNYLGYDGNEYIGQPMEKFHADPAVIRDILSRLRKDETLRNYPARIIAKDGALKHVIINANVLRKNGQFIYSRCFSRDFSDMKLEEQRRSNLFMGLAENEARLRMAIESTKLGTWDFDPTTDALEWSDECMHIYGVQPGTVIDFKLFTGLMHPEDRDYIVSEINTSMERPDAKPFDITHRIIRYNDHAVRWVRGQGKVYFNPLQKPVRFIGTVVDITDARTSELKSLQLASIVKTSNDAVVSKTLDGIVMTWNKAAEKTFGYQESEMVGASILKIIPEDRHQEEFEILAKLRRGESLENYETKRVTKTGKLLDVSLTISPLIDHAGNVIGSSKIARDITDKKMEEQRKNDFISLVSHELKTPLTTILGFSQLLLLQANDAEDVFTVDALRKMERQAKRMSTMISEFLDLARLEEGKFFIKKEVFDIALLLEEAVQDARILGAHHQIVLNPTENILVYADKSKIGHVLANLISNAIKYSAAGSTITVSCDKVNDKVKIAVRDEGVGISPANQKNLFQRFYRVPDEKIRHVNGVGIGLYLVAEIIKHHDSKIEIESHEDRGSVFSFSLDISRSKAPSDT